MGIISVQVGEAGHLGEGIPRLGNAPTPHCHHGHPTVTPWAPPPCVCRALTRVLTWWDRLC